MRQLMQLLFIVGLQTCLAATLVAQQAERPFVHPLFSDHMVLQQGKVLPVWGWTAPRAKVTVTFGDENAVATADALGKWVARLGPLTASFEGVSLQVSGHQTATFEDVVVGDVWICSGQSNMEWPVSLSDNAQQEIAQATNSNIRLFTVAKRIAMQPEEWVEGTWSVCSPESVARFSAVGYYFGRALTSKVHCPIGLIHTSWGGTVAEAWTSGEALRTMDDFDDEVADLEQTAKEMASGDFDLNKRIAEWWAANDQGSLAEKHLAQPGVDHRDWKTMDLPTNWESANVGMDKFDGIVWFRREFTLPAEWHGQDAILSLGPIDDVDTTWVNGREVGSMSRWNAPRNYPVKSADLKPGKNVIAVRVYDHSGGGGIYDKNHTISLKLADDETKSIPLDGAWHFNISAPKSKLSPFPQLSNQNPNRVTVLYNGMLAPLTPFGIKGAIWYQGESNAGRPEQYRRLLPTMIEDWRTRFGQGDFPFLIVQLANFMERQSSPVQPGWAELREAQQLTADRDEHVGLAVTTDIGEAHDIHPRNKQDVGNRLALQAFHIAYDFDNVVHSGPTVKDMGILGDSVFIEFDNVGGGLVARGDTLQGFAIAEATGEFFWADAKIKGHTVYLSNEHLAEPIRVRYNWANNPIGNLFNKEGLPAAPFRTDRPR